MNKFKRSVFGQAIGDAVGVPYEFKIRDSFVCTDMVGFGTWNKPVGTYSDDTSMLLCTLNAIGHKNFQQKVIQNFIKWMDKGFMSINNETFDIGNTTFKALNCHKKKELIPNNEFTNGNGSLMRMIPLSFWLMNFDKKKRHELIKSISSITHPHEISVVCCIEAVDVAINLINGKSLFDSIPNSGHIKNMDIDKIKSDGFVKNTLIASLWVLLNTYSFKEAILKAINLGEDTDTTAAVVGAFAGIIYEIPEDWYLKLRNKNIILEQILQAQKHIHQFDL